MRNEDEHCLVPPCKRKRNRKTKKQLAGAPRHPGGELVDTPAQREARLLREMSTPRKRAPATPPPQRVVYPFTMKTPSGKTLSLFGNSEQERTNMIENLTGYGYEFIS